MLGKQSVLICRDFFFLITPSIHLLTRVELTTHSYTLSHTHLHFRILRQRCSFICPSEPFSLSPSLSLSCCECFHCVTKQEVPSSSFDIMVLDPKEKKMDRFEAATKNGEWVELCRKSFLTVFTKKKAPTLTSHFRRGE